MKTGVNVDFSGLNRRLERMQKNAVQSDRIMGNVSIWMYKDAMNHFKEEKGPEGSWKPLKYASINRRSRRVRGKSKTRHKILQDTGILRASIAPKSNKNSAMVYTNVKYGITHQKGDPSRNIPQRKFLWLSDAAKERILKSIGKFYLGET